MTNAIEKLAHMLKVESAMGDDPVLSHVWVIGKILSAIQADPFEYLEVKPLEWRRMEKEFMYVVKNPWLYETTNHMYQIYQCEKYWTVMMGSLVIKLDSCLTLESAKAAAQTDYENRLKECF